MAKNTAKSQLVTESTLKEIQVRVGKDPTWEKLGILRELTRKTGALYEPQVIQLRLWPLVFLDASEAEAEFIYDTRQITFKVKIKKKPVKFKERLEFLDKAVKQLLGDEYSVLVYRGNKEVYYGSAISDS